MRMVERKTDAAWDNRRHVSYSKCVAIAACLHPITHPWTNHSKHSFTSRGFSVDLVYFFCRLALCPVYAYCAGTAVRATAKVIPQTARRISRGLPACLTYTSISSSSILPTRHTKRATSRPDLPFPLPPCFRTSSRQPLRCGVSLSLILSRAAMAADIARNRREGIAVFGQGWVCDWRDSGRGQGRWASRRLRMNVKSGSGHSEVYK